MRETGYAAAALLVSVVVLFSACGRRDDGGIGTAEPAPSADSGAPVRPDEAPSTATTNARFVGRFIADAEGGMRSAWPGSAITARFQGTSIAMRLKDEGFNLFQVVVDGDAKRVVRTDKSRDRWLLADGLRDETHEVTVYRRTEPKVGETVFLGFEVGGGGSLLKPPDAPVRRIEIIGDSISTGYGNEGPGPVCGYANTQQNAFLTYGALAARALGADHTIIAWSGKTLFEMRGYFDKVLPARDDSRWDFSQWQPHVVVVNVGTNNFALVDPGEKRFLELYLALVDRVRAAYPRAFIVCALGPMLSDVYPEGHKNLTQARKYMHAAVAKMKAAGDRNLELLEFPEQNHADGLGCGFHPSLKTHERMAERLVRLLRRRLGW
jgi:lysophospholipase L1-like esterase